MKLDAEKIYALLIEAGEAWADANAAADLLEETKKSVLAKLMNECPHAAVSAKEMIALADPKFTEFVKGMVSARKTANKLRVRYDSAKTLSELRRSEESTRRQEMSHA